MSQMNFFAELRRRNVFRMAGLYLVAAWLVTQVAATLLPGFDAPPWVFRAVVTLLAIGFVPVLVFAWVFEITPEGLKRESEIDRTHSTAPETGRRMDRSIIAVLLLALVVFAVDRFVLAPQRETKAVAAALAQTESRKPVEPAMPASAADASKPIPTIEADPSIAVLPLVNLSSDKEQEYFSDGVSEELLNLLAKVPKLRVIARTSSFSFKGKDVPIDQIARTLNVAAVLEGSVRKSKDTVRIQVQLIRANDGTQLWSQTYDRTLEDIFAIQDEIASDVVKQLQLTLRGAAPKSRPTNPESYALYLQAIQLARLNTAESFRQSDALLRKALTLDPRYAHAWTALARNLTNQAGQGLLAFGEAFTQAREAAMKALEIDPDHALAHAMMGRVAMTGENDLAAAADHFKRALALAPWDLDVLRASTPLLANLGRLDDVLAIHEAVLRRDPVNLGALANLGYFQGAAGRYDAAIASYRTLLGLAPGRGNAHAQLGNALLEKGDAPGALAEIERETNEFWKMSGLPIAYHALGRKADSDAALSALIATHEAAALNIAFVFAFRGEVDQAFEWLDKAATQGDAGLNDFVPDAMYANVREDPRWLPFLRKIGRAPEQLALIEFEVTLPP